MQLLLLNVTTIEQVSAVPDDRFTHVRATPFATNTDVCCNHPFVINVLSVARAGGRFIYLSGNSR